MPKGIILIAAALAEINPKYFFKILNRISSYFPVAGASTFIFICRKYQVKMVLEPWVYATNLLRE
jgi:hypothetical protein